MAKRFFSAARLFGAAFGFIEKTRSVFLEPLREKRVATSTSLLLVRSTKRLLRPPTSGLLFSRSGGAQIKARSLFGGEASEKTLRVYFLNRRSLQ